MAVACDLVTALRLANDRKANVNSGVDDLRSAPFKEPAFHTWRAILKKIQRNLRSLPPLQDDQGNYLFYFDNAQLANAAGVSTRTVQRHREILQDAGLIAYETFRGRQHPFLMAVPPQFLGLGEVLDGAAIAATIGRETAVAIASDDKLSALPTETLSKEYKTAVEKGASTQVPGFAPADGADDDARSASMGDQQEGTTGDTEATGAEADRTPFRPAGGAIERKGGRLLDAVRERDIEALGAELWDFALKELWPGLPLSQAQVAQAQAHIRGYYSRAWDMGNVRQWHDAFVSMVSATREYLDRDPRDRWEFERLRAMGGIAQGGGGSSPIKKRFIVSPNMWFDPAFRGGFAGVWKWQVRKAHAAKSAAIDLALQKAYNEWMRNLRKPPSKRRNELELYREITNTIAQLKSDDALRRWSLIVSGVREGVQDAR